MTGPAAPGGSVRPAAALALATISFVALFIFGLGMTSLATGEDVIAVRGLGQSPGIVAAVVATGVFAVALWPGLRRVPPTYWAAAWTAAATFLAYLLALVVAVVATGGDLASAVAVAGRISTTWFGVVVAGAAAVCAWGGVALVRTRASRPRWPWEDEFDE
ncbi:hypothetical protein JOD63_002291 [Microbacterium terrae]|uniref:Uncharacterized protein n=1 Tax=Microbacterium terrae TaxID=69369 RepID=A0A0M2H5V4_9MICO|nr:hypothetical protein [Microbacterium terrae]KJL39389.1 hypothetical protein RS81_02019 [Microbacterium terrae]MBP1078323.1 hypothetical protein [Microbacterium terrae]GLJ97802.1 hypothetical protein GCM10017594_09990 [Microbacterium terrae]